MQVKRKYLIGFGVALVAAGVTMWVISHNRKKKEINQLNAILDGKAADPSSSGSQVIIPKTQYDQLPAGSYPLKFGDKNKKVYEVQRLLNSKFNTGLDLDGKFGQSTASAMCKHVWTSCFTDVQSRLYTITNADVAKLTNS